MTRSVHRGVGATDEADDLELLRRYHRRADMSAFAAIVARHQERLLRTGHAITADAEAAEDAAQEAFLRLCREAGPLLASARGRSDLGGWLVAVARNLALDHLRRRRPAALPDELPASAPAESLPGDGLWAAVAELPPLERAAVILRYRDQLDYRAVAEALGKSVSHVGVILHSAIARLREHPALRAEVLP